MKKHWIAVVLFCLAICLWIAVILQGCSLYVSIEGKPKLVTTIPCETAPLQAVSKEKPKTKYEVIREEHNTEWLNLPHHPEHDTLFQPK